MNFHCVLIFAHVLCSSLKHSEKVICWDVIRTLKSGSNSTRAPEARQARGVLTLVSCATHFIITLLLRHTQFYHLCKHSQLLFHVLPQLNQCHGQFLVQPTSPRAANLKSLALSYASTCSTTQQPGAQAPAPLQALTHNAPDHNELTRKTCVSATRRIQATATARVLQSNYAACLPRLEDPANFPCRKPRSSI